MSTKQISQLRKLPDSEKIMLAQWLWGDIARDKNLDALPEEHRKILSARMDRINDGKTKFMTWKQFLNKFRKMK